jgi:hypothetical protein
LIEEGKNRPSELERANRAADLAYGISGVHEFLLGGARHVIVNDQYALSIIVLYTDFFSVGDNKIGRRFLDLESEPFCTIFLYARPGNILSVSCVGSISREMYGLASRTMSQIADTMLRIRCNI